MVITTVWLLPVFCVGCSLIAMFGSYIIGVILGHLPSIIPFISDGGARPPEGCVFAQFLNLAAFFLIATCYIRHRQIIEYYGHRLHQRGPYWRGASMILMLIAVLSAVGITIVANFPDSEVPKVHFIGAKITFLAAIVYAWGQVIFGYLMTPRMTSPFVSHLRAWFVLVATVCLVVHELSMKYNLLVPPGAPPRPSRSAYGVRWYDPDSPYFKNYILTTGCEWTMVIFTQFFILSFAAELRFAYMHAPLVHFTGFGPSVTPGPSTSQHQVEIKVESPQPECATAEY